MNKGSDNIALGGGAKLSYGPSSELFPVSLSEFKENVAYQNVSILAGITKHDGSFLLAGTKEITSEETKKIQKFYFQVFIIY